MAELTPYGTKALDLARGFYAARKIVWDTYAAHGRPVKIASFVADFHNDRLTREKQRVVPIEAPKRIKKKDLHAFLVKHDIGAMATRRLQGHLGSGYEPFDRVPQGGELEAVHHALERMATLRLQIFNHNAPMVDYTARQVVRKQPQCVASSKVAYEDLVQEGMIGLSRAIDKFDPNLPYAFATYAILWIRQGMTRSLRKNRLIKIPVNKNWEGVVQSAEANVASGVDLRRIDTLATPELPAEVDPDVRHDIQVLADTVPNERDRRIFLARSKGYTLHEIGQTIGLTRERVRQRLKAVLDDLREEYLLEQDTLAR